MITIPIVGEDEHDRAEFLCRRTLPKGYMEDFSLLGLMVEQLEQAVAVLKDGGYSAVVGDHGGELQLASGRQLPGALALLTRNMRVRFGDIADTLYQA